MKMRRIKIKRTMLIIIEFVTTFAAYALFAWADWRIAVGMAVFEISNIVGDILNGTTGGKNADI